MDARDNTELDAYIESLGIGYEAAFVPQSISRNAGEARPSLNWKVTLKRGAKKITTDYSQGAGHIPKSIGPCSKMPGSYRAALVREREEDAAETGSYAVNLEGLYQVNLKSLHRKKLPAPDSRDVLWSLVLDGTSGEVCFEEWASEYGYDSDSIAALKVYEACRSTGYSLRRLFSLAELEHLKALFQEY